MSEPVIEIRGLGVRYGRRRVLDDVGLEVDAGEVVALLGRNGEGKTSLVRCLLGQQKASAGSCRLFGHGTWPRRPELMRRLGFVPEEPDAPGSLSGAALGRFSERVHEAWDGAAYAARLERYGVPASTPFRSLSRGQKAQVMLSLALAHEPELLVLDDPTLGLDAVSRRGVYEEVVGELAERELTVFLASHDLAGVESIVTRVAVLRGGSIVLDEDLEALKHRVRWVELHLETGDGEDLILPAGSDADFDELVGAAAPLERTRHGRRLRLLAGAYGPELNRRLESVLGAGRVVVSPASLEEIVVALDGVDPR